MAFTADQQLQLLLNDVRGTRWTATMRRDALAQMRQHVAHEERAVQTRQTLVLQANQSRYTLPADHVQTFGVLSGNFQASIRLLDSAGVAWWLTVTTAGDLGLSSVPPTGDGLLASVDRTGIRLTAADASVWYLYPTVWGDVAVSSVAPAGTIQTQLPELRDIDGNPWYLTISNAGDLGTTQTPSASPLLVSPLALLPLQRQELTAFVHADALATPGQPRYYVTQGRTLLVSPPPVQAMRCEHLYFAETTAPLTAPWQTVTLFESAAWVAQRTWPADAVQAMQAMALHLRERLRESYVPGDRDSVEAFQGRGV